MRYTRPRERCIDNPHHDSADEQREADHPKALQVFSYHFRQQPGWNRGHDERDDGQAEGMRQKIAITALTSRICREEFQDPVPKINRQGQDRAELDHDRVHLPKAVVQIEIEERFDDAEMTGRTHRQKFGQPFNNAEKNRY